MQPTKKNTYTSPPTLAQQFFRPPFYQQGSLANLRRKTTLPNTRVVPGSLLASSSAKQKKTHSPRYLRTSRIPQPNDIRTRYLLASRLSGYSSYLMHVYAIMPPYPFPLRPKYQHPKFCATLNAIQEEETNNGHDSPPSVPTLSLNS